MENSIAIKSVIVPKLLRKYNNGLGRIIAINTKIASIEQPAKDAAALAKQLADNAAILTEPLYEQIASERQLIASAMKKDRRSLLRRHATKTRHGKVVTVPNGELSMQLIPKKVFLLEDSNWVIRRLLNVRGGKRYLRIKHELDLDSLKSATPRILNLIGARVYRTEWFYIQPNGDSKRTNIAIRRYPNTKDIS